MFSQPIDRHLRLKLASVLDAEALFSLVERNRAELDRWFNWSRSVTSVAAARAWLAQAGAGWADLTHIVTLVLLDSDVIGSVTLHHMNQADGFCELGYWLDAAQRGHGYMTAAVGQVERLCFGDLKLRRVAIHADTDNQRSQALAKRRGYRFEGVLRAKFLRGDGSPGDEAVYSLLRDDWAARAVVTTVT